MREDESKDLFEITLPEPPGEKKEIYPDTKAIIKHSLLFILTFGSIAVTVGFNFVGHSAYAENFLDVIIPEGLLFAALFLGFLGSHEFGHYFAAVYHRVRTTLPYFVPVPFIIPIGTVGAVIRIKERIDETRKLFDIGVAGPLAGFVVSLLILIYGFMTLPGPEYIENFAGHAEVIEHIEEEGTYPEEPVVQEAGQLLVLGNTLLYDFISSFFENTPPLWEAYHYPFLFAGWLGLFFTALNLMPVGQLDGGHILYSLVGYKRHRIFARIFFGLIIALGGASVIPYLESIFANFGFPAATSAWATWAVISFFLLRKAYRTHSLWTLPTWIIALVLAALFSFGGFFPEGATRPLFWLVWGLIILFFIGIEHPPVSRETELTPGRRILGWVSMAIFFLCISPNPIYILN